VTSPLIRVEVWLRTFELIEVKVGGAVEINVSILLKGTHLILRWSLHKGRIILKRFSHQP
jgi:hypothetical protein